MKKLASYMRGDSITAIARFMNIVGIPILSIISTVAVSQFNTIVDNQEAMIKLLDKHDKQIQTNSASIIKLLRNDQLVTAKQDATISSLKINTKIGMEFYDDYDQKYDELLEENKFLNQ